LDKKLLSFGVMNIVW